MLSCVSGALVAPAEATPRLAPPHPANAQLRGEQVAVPPVHMGADQTSLVTEAVATDLGDGLHVTTTVRVTSSAVILQTTAWRARGSGVARGAVGVYLVDAAGTVIDASDIHRFHTRWQRVWGGSARDYTWIDPRPFGVVGLKTTSVVVCHGQTIAGVARICAWPWMHSGR